ncbi:MAG: tRNA pseudouridine(38-40) synthase TruA [Lachnospiraceae bacterium]|nr:tRNA pseudouridine(38-40) synthase TruA [Lachnospiraceae bacterium]
MKPILITVSYDGTLFNGWQSQKKEGIRTIQETLEDAFSRLFGVYTEVLGASRTDTGVHALGQRALIKTESSIPTSHISYAINSLLPEDVRVVDAVEVPCDFHPRYNVIKKTYEYKILNSRYKNPVLRNYTECVYEKLDIIKMKEALKFFLGEHDFSAFRATGSGVKGSIRTIYEASLEKEGDIISLKITGNGFLYNMVRIMAGTLINVGKGKIEPFSVKDILESKDRKKAGKTAGPQGLILLSISYNI